jgi:hypothetical protein
MFRGDILQASAAHGAGTEHDLTRPAVECLEELDAARHRVGRESRKSPHKSWVVREQAKGCERRANSKVGPFFNPEVFAVATGIGPCPIAWCRG